jgi:hypothetical protein
MIVWHQEFTSPPLASRRGATRMGQPANTSGPQVERFREYLCVDGGSKWRRGAAEFGSAGLVKVSERQEWCVAEEV